MERSENIIICIENVWKMQFTIASTYIVKEHHYNEVLLNFIHRTFK